MSRLRARRHLVEHENVERWLVSYADYMTLLFALFVVLYAMARVNEKPFATATESLGRVFQAQEAQTKNRGHGDDILPVNSVKTKQVLFGDAIVDVAEPDIVSGEVNLSTVSDTQVGSSLSSLEKDLHEALYELVESGYAQLQIDGDWLEIELNSSLLFPSGSASPTNGAKDILLVIYQIIADTNNYIRVRGYTDNQAIKTEIFSSNWELSVFRATAILRTLEALTLNPARMAIEGYGQYYPSADNSTSAGRAKNRRVVIALSKYGLEKAKVVAPPSISEENVAVINRISTSMADDEIRIIELDNGGIRITTRAETKANNEATQPSQAKTNER
ncbi:OmpA family protein [Colwellia sp. MB02u-18]|uniref:flagellar motor protein MotB n=1 Tax=unclassified Colwellia TaxID=196834 RepID=UPI0015F3E811|nr:MULTISPECIES: flagellar motor protein MotB [unclassified Colwellia]MBA6223159.1 OmpA family protein [Colwellia sp. MB3u-45]MBA6267583.1 OmpA family protein [Colwellia sp. MB3u-43]MBA6320290.1 OmpA family protein [Colwellia sp. MB02u-19]MBA6323049.1 OmpA family protein [Colwellia sp. MB02u-18]MBA6330382.1 OmpA family protein [Colwellia sp. MB02u-12]